MSTKLYRAYSEIDNFLGRDGVRLTWFVPERKTPLELDYVTLIEDFDAAKYARLNADHDAGYGLSDKEIGFLQFCDCAIGFINEHFTEAEAAHLADYLEKTYGVIIQTEEARLPTNLQVVPTVECSLSEGVGFFKLPEEDENGYDLPVPVWGFYDLRLNPLAASSAPYIGYGIAYLETALEKLGFAPVAPEVLAKVVAALATERGLKVGQEFETNANPQPEAAQNPADGDFLGDIMARYTIEYENEAENSGKN
jgi:hypothetical protein